MKPIESFLVVGIVLFAVVLVVMKFLKPFGKAKGSCRACGETCGCDPESKKSTAHPK